MSKRQRSLRKPSKDDDGESIGARVTLDLGRVQGVYDFEQVAISTDNPETVRIIFAKTDGKSIEVELLRAELRSLISWRMIINL